MAHRMCPGYSVFHLDRFGQFDYFSMRCKVSVEAFINGIAFGVYQETIGALVLFHVFCSKMCLTERG